MVDQPALTIASPRPSRIARPRRRPTGWQLAAYVGLSLGGLATLLPFVWMLLAAFKPQREIIALPPVWLTANPTLDNLARVWTRVNFARYFLNSLVAAVLITLIVILTSSFVGYVFAKYRFWGRDALFIAILAAMMIP
ncbi:MAG TPA: hypothetical protein VIL85_07025 [Thermomicrobiales bacterium]|jgi:multiple sugar transport system permease protein